MRAVQAQVSCTSGKSQPGSVNYMFAILLSIQANLSLFGTIEMRIDRPSYHCLLVFVLYLKCMISCHCMNPCNEKGKGQNTIYIKHRL